MTPSLDWLSRLLEMTPVRGQLDLRCLYGAPWRIDAAIAAEGEMPYHVVLAGSAMLEDASGGSSQRLTAGDIVMIANGDAHALHDGGGKRAKPARERSGTNLIFSENAGTGARLDMLCGRFLLTSTHARLLRAYLPERLIVHARDPVEPATAAGTDQHLARLMTLMRMESSVDSLGGRAMLDALSTALFALTVRLASESREAPPGLLSLAGYPRLAPALEALFHHPEHPWTLPTLAQRCNMSRATFARLFQEKLGHSANDLLTDVRMTLAANALRKSSISTGAVAEMVGFQSEASFQRAFKLHMGMTPARWRRSVS